MNPVGVESVVSELRDVAKEIVFVMVFVLCGTG